MSWLPPLRFFALRRLDGIRQPHNSWKQPTSRFGAPSAFLTLSRLRSARYLLALFHASSALGLLLPEVDPTHGAVTLSRGPVPSCGYLTGVSCLGPGYVEQSGTAHRLPSRHQEATSGPSDPLQGLVPRGRPCSSDGVLRRKTTATPVHFLPRVFSLLARALLGAALSWAWSSVGHAAPTITLQSTSSEQIGLVLSNLPPLARFPTFPTDHRDFAIPRLASGEVRPLRHVASVALSPQRP